MFFRRPAGSTPAGSIPFGKEDFMKRKIIVLLLAVLFFSCHKLESGVVVKKYFVAAHQQPITTVVSNGKK